VSLDDSSTCWYCQLMNGSSNMNMGTSSNSSNTIIPGGTPVNNNYSSGRPRV